MPSVKQSAVVERLQQTINKFVAQTHSLEIGAPRIRCVAVAELDGTDGFIRAEIQMKYRADEESLDVVRQEPPCHVDLNSVEEGA